LLAILCICVWPYEPMSSNTLGHQVSKVLSHGLWTGIGTPFRSTSRWGTRGSMQKTR
jgi:hypothetical protein